jgi:hypothetical protein
MKRIIGSAVLSGLAVLLSAAESKAEIPACFTLRGVIYVEGEITAGGGDVVKQKLERVRFSNSDLLFSLAELFALNLPRGACIRVTPEDDPTPDSVALVDAEGNVLQDLTGVVTVNLDTDPNLFSGSINTVTLAESSLSLHRIEITIAIPGDMIDFTLEGVAFQRLRVGAEQENGLNKMRVSTKAKLTGGGSAFGFDTFIEGKGALSGSGEFDREL